MLDVLLDRLMYVVFLPLRPPALSPQCNTYGHSRRLSSLLCPLGQHQYIRLLQALLIYDKVPFEDTVLEWGRLGGFTVVNIAYMNVSVWRGASCLSFSLRFIGVLSLVQNETYSASSSFIFKTKGSFNIIRQSLSSEKCFAESWYISSDLLRWPC